MERDRLGLLEEEEVKTSLRGNRDSLLGEIPPTGLLPYAFISLSTIDQAAFGGLEALRTS